MERWGRSGCTGDVGTHGWAVVAVVEANPLLPLYASPLTADCGRGLSMHHLLCTGPAAAPPPLTLDRPPPVHTFLTSRGSSRSASSPCPSSQLTAPSTVLLPEKCSARVARARGKPMSSSSLRSVSSTTAGTF